MANQCLVFFFLYINLNRIPDFGELMKENKLVSYLLSEPNSSGLPIDRASNRMERWTQYWPMTIGSTIVFNMGVHMETLTRMIVNEELTDDQVIECKKIIYNLLALESRNEPLPPTCSGHRDRGAKGNRREEQYRILFKVLSDHCPSFQNLHRILFRNARSCFDITVEVNSTVVY